MIIHLRCDFCGDDIHGRRVAMRRPQLGAARPDRVGGGTHAGIKQRQAGSSGVAQMSLRSAEVALAASELAKRHALIRKAACFTDDPPGHTMAANLLVTRRWMISEPN